MGNSELSKLIDTSHFIDDSLKFKCKEYFKQIPKGLGDWFYSKSTPQIKYQGDIIDKLDLVYFEAANGVPKTQHLKDTPSILLSNTCDMDFKGKTREKYISIAPLLSFEEYANNRIQEYTEERWKYLLADIKANKITDILYIPKKESLEASIIPLDRIFSIDPNMLQNRLDRNISKIIASLSQIGFYFFLIKLTYHFARYEDKSEIKRR